MRQSLALCLACAPPVIVIAPQIAAAQSAERRARNDLYATVAPPCAAPARDARVIGRRDPGHTDPHRAWS